MDSDLVPSIHAPPATSTTSAVTRATWPREGQARIIAHQLTTCSSRSLEADADTDDAVLSARATATRVRWRGVAR